MLGSISALSLVKNKTKNPSSCKYPLNVNGCPGWLGTITEIAVFPLLLLRQSFHFNNLLLTSIISPHPTPNSSCLIIAPPSLLVATVSMGEEVRGKETGEKEGEMRRNSALLSLWVPLLALTSFLEEARSCSHSGLLNRLFPNPGNSYLALTQLLIPFPVLTIGVIPQSQHHHQSLESGNRGLKECSH